MTQAATRPNGRRGTAAGVAVLAAATFALSACGNMTPQQEAHFQSDPPFWHEEPQED